MRRKSNGIPAQFPARGQWAAKINVTSWFVGPRPNFGRRPISWPCDLNLNVYPSESILIGPSAFDLRLKSPGINAALAAHSRLRLRAALAAEPLPMSQNAEGAHARLNSRPRTGLKSPIHA